MASRNEHTERYHYASITELLIDSINVLDIWPFDPRHTIGVFVLSLESDYWSTFSDLGVGNDSTARLVPVQRKWQFNDPVPSNIGNVVLRSLKIATLIGSQDVRSTREPSWESSTGDLRIDLCLGQPAAP